MGYLNLNYYSINYLNCLRLAVANEKETELGYSENCKTIEQAKINISLLVIFLLLLTLLMLYCYQHQAYQLRTLFTMYLQIPVKVIQYRL